mmetsp:Transcript_17558/g.24758  ORF Transcript_17558/g.24758 Transcript_17558/m.24758 type:complete len:365 (+) Transcript_17558:101-1195(+)
MNFITQNEHQSRTKAPHSYISMAKNLYERNLYTFLDVTHFNHTLRSNNVNQRRYPHIYSSQITSYPDRRSSCNVCSLSSGGKNRHRMSNENSAIIPVKSSATMPLVESNLELEVALILSKDFASGGHKVVQIQWDKMYAQLGEYFNKNGHCNVPFDYAPDPGLGKWVATQRSMHKTFTNGNVEALSSERVKKLEAINFQWEVKRQNVDSTIKSWESRLEDLKAFRRKCSHCNVPRDWPEDPSLALWVRNQRGAFKKWLACEKSNMNYDRARKLEEIGFKWSIKRTPVRKHWDVRFNEVREYKEKYGDCNVPRRWKGDETLGRWVRQQRYDYDTWRAGKKSNLTNQRVERLNSIGFKWRLKGERR